MATNTPTPQEEQIVLVRGSEEYKEYMRHQSGRIKSLVNGIEDFLSVSGRTLLLVFVLYTTIKAGMTVTGHQVPWLIDILMLAFQVCGLEGSIPGLSRFRESLLLKNTQAATADAETIRKTIKSARTLNFLTGVEIMLAAYANNHNIALGSTPITIAYISEFYSYVLLLSRLWFITSFIIEMSRLEVKKPKIISQAEYDKQQLQAEQEQIRIDNTNILETIDQAIAHYAASQPDVASLVQQALDRWTQSQPQQPDVYTIVSESMDQIGSLVSRQIEEHRQTQTEQIKVLQLSLKAVQNTANSGSGIDTEELFSQMEVIVSRRIEATQATQNEKIAALIRLTEATQVGSTSNGLIDSEALALQIEAALSRSSTELKQSFEARISEVSRQVSRVEASTANQMSSLQEKNAQALAEAEARHSEELKETRTQIHAIANQISSLQEKNAQALAEAEARHSEELKKTITRVHAVLQEAKAMREPAKTTQAKITNITEAREERQKELTAEEVKKLIEADPSLLKLSGSDLGQKVGTSKATANRAKSKYLEAHPEATQNSDSGELEAVNL